MPHRPRPPRGRPPAAATCRRRTARQLVVPLAGREVEQHRARGVGAVGDVCGAPVSFHTSQPSTVPKASSRAAGRCARGSTPASSPRSTGRGRARPPADQVEGSSAHRAAVRRSCQTIAGCTGRLAPRSQTTVVSRWFVIPIASRSPAATPAAASASAAVCSTLAQISSGSCSTQPGRGKRCSARGTRARAPQLRVDDEARRAGRPGRSPGSRP